MSYPFWFNNKNFQLDDIKVSKEQYDRYIRICNTNISKTSTILLSKKTKEEDKMKRVYLIDGKIYCGDISDKDCFHEIVEVEEHDEKTEKRYDTYIL